MTSKPASSRASREADFEEDTLLPPPAPGLLPPTADHGFDPPTLPGLGAKVVTAAPRETAVPVPTHEAPPSWPNGQSVDGAAPVSIPERYERTLRMPMLPMRAQPVPEPVQPVDSGSALVLPPPPEVTPAATPAVPDEVERESTRPMLLSPSRDPAEETLPPLPPVPARETLFAQIRYAGTVTRSLYHRRQVSKRVHGEIAALLREHERALVQLGQRAFADAIDPLTEDPRVSSEWEAAPVAAAPPKPTETVLRREAERAAVRYQAMMQKELASREQRSAGLASELRAQSRRRRQIRAEHLALQARALGLPAAHPLTQKLRQTEAQLAAMESTMRAQAERLGAARAEIQLRRRTLRHSIGPRLPLALSARLCALSGQAPHLLVLGGIVAEMRLGPSGARDRGAAYARLYRQLETTQSELAARQGLVARLDSDLLAYDRESVRRVVGGGVLILAALLALVAVAWVLTS